MLNLLFFLLIILYLVMQSMTYSCNSSTCVLPVCYCPTASPPGNMKPEETPQLVMITYDDAMTITTFPAALSVLSYKNPNGCPIRSTWFLQHTYTDYHCVQQWHSRGHEVADHTVNHVTPLNANEILMLRQILGHYSHINASEFVGYRSPFLETNTLTLDTLFNNKFLWDCSITLDAGNGFISKGASNMMWPYTLDNGFASSCEVGTCDSLGRYPGLWSIPMYNFFNSDGTVLASMDPVGSFYDILVQSFNFHYKGNRSPFGIWLHPAFLMADPVRISDLNRFIIWTQTDLLKDSVWYVTGSQVIDFILHPAPIGSYSGDTCAPRPILSTEICDGLDNDMNGLIDEGVVSNCGYSFGSFNLCGSCPVEIPTLVNPFPATANTLMSLNSIGTQCKAPSLGCGLGFYNVDLCQCECDLVHFNSNLNLFVAGSCLDLLNICSIQRIPIKITASNIAAVTSILNSLSSGDPASPRFVPRFTLSVFPLWNSSLTFLCLSQISTLQDSIIDHTVYLTAVSLLNGSVLIPNKAASSDLLETILPKFNTPFTTSSVTTKLVSSTIFASEIPTFTEVFPTFASEIPNFTEVSPTNPTNLLLNETLRNSGFQINQLSGLLVLITFALLVIL